MRSLPSQMTSLPISRWRDHPAVSPGDSLSRAYLRLVESGLPRLPVVDRGELVGWIDLAAIEQAQKNEYVSQRMVAPVAELEINDSAERLVTEFLERPLGGVVIREGERWQEAYTSEQVRGWIEKKWSTGVSIKQWLLSLGSTG